MAAHFDLPDIKLFVNIAEANSLTRGAERSHMSLPAASTVAEDLPTAQLQATIASAAAAM